MKRLLVILTVIIVVAAIATIFIPSKINAEGKGPRDPHYHTGGWTVCMNELPRACDAEAE